MPFPYPYNLTLPLSPSMLRHRRTLLNRAGLIAYLSPIAILLAIFAIRVAFRFINPSKQTSSTRKSKLKSKPPSPLTLTTRRIAWLLTHTGPPFTTEFGPWGVILLGVLYAGYLLALAMLNTGRDYMHLTKSLAHVAVAQLPLHYLLAIKSPYSPITLATGLTHERLNAVHRAFGRIVHGFLAAHAVLYLNFFVRLDILEAKLGEPAVRLGIGAFWTLNFLGMLALPVVRRRMYHRLFYRSHVVLSAALLVLLWYHVPYTRVYVGQAGAIWVLNGAARWLGYTTGVSRARVEKVEGTELLKLSVPVPGTHPVVKFVAGQHVYLNRAAAGSGVGFGPRTPFTVVDVTEVGKDSMGYPKMQVQLVVRNMHGPQTGWFAANAGEGGGVDVILEGPYGEAGVYMPALLEQKGEKVCVVAGGVGATYAIPVYVALVRSRGSSTGVSFVWVVRSVKEARWGIEMLSALESAAVLDVEIYVTREEEGVESLLGGKGKRRLKEGIRVHALGKRPGMGEVLGGAFASGVGKKGGEGGKTKGEHKHERVTVLACGPVEMMGALKARVGGYVMGEGREVGFHEEVFGFGA